MVMMKNNNNDDDKMDNDKSNLLWEEYATFQQAHPFPAFSLPTHA